MRNFIFRSWLSLGDIVLFTAAVRDLQLHFPNRYRVDVRTCFPDLWAYNPYLTRLEEYGPDIKVVDCVLPLIDRSHGAACHAIHCFIDFFNQYLGLSMKPTAFRGDIHLSRRERGGVSQVHRLTGANIPFWLISAGGKHDCTIKWWEARRYQEVVDHFRGRIQFVQVGDLAHYHPKLDGVIDLRGRTTVRELVRLVYHAEGVLCGVTGLMHLAAAVPLRPDRYPARHCVVVAGGREPPHWEAYPGHQFIHTVGMLHCCAKGGCWKDRTVPLGDGDDRDGNRHLCVEVRNGLPRCMDMISSADVIGRIERCFEGGAARSLTRRQARAAERGVEASSAGEVAPKPLNFHTAPDLAARFIETIPPYPGGFAGRGIVICGGGVAMFANAWVCINMLRRLGCKLPIQLWHRGAQELDGAMRALVRLLGVECVDVERVQRQHPARLSQAWATKPYAILHCPFKKVLLLDADNVPVRDPEFLFETAEFRRTGAVFWPDYWRLKRSNPAWKLFSVVYRDEPEFESGQILVNKEACWRPLNLCLWYNERSDLFYRYVYGDKETFHMAFLRLNAAYAMPARPIHRLKGTMCQHDFEGRRLFQHRNTAKWSLYAPNRRVRGFWHETECREFLRELRRTWDGQIEALRPRRVEWVGAGTGGVDAKAEVSLVAFLVTCAEREGTRQQTLANLAQTDWRERPVEVVLDEKRFTKGEDRVTHTAWRALKAGVETGADYILYLEDDLEFNDHFLHNLQAWPLLARGEIGLASLFNCGLRELERIGASDAITIDPMGLFGSQALIVSRRTARFFLANWSEGPAPVDLKMGALAARLKWPVFCHRPSLVKHVGWRSIVGGGFPQARDFKREWKAPVRSATGLRVVSINRPDSMTESSSPRPSLPSASAKARAGFVQERKEHEVNSCGVEDKRV